MSDYFSKFSRQILLPEIGRNGQMKLATARVLVVGAGGLGCPVIQYLNAAGITQLTVIDDDIVSENNLHRQVIYSEENIGLKKVAMIAARFSAVKTICDKLTIENALSIIANYDIVVDTTDNFSTRYLINDACVLLDKILVSASVQKFAGQLAVFNYPLVNQQRSGTYRCLFPEPPSENLNCDTAGVLGTVAGIMGTLQANEVIKVITGAGNVLANQLLLFDGLRMEARILKYVRNEREVDAILQNGLQETHFFPSCENENVNEITVDELKQELQSKNSIQLIDVREEEEHHDFNIGGKNIPLSQIVKQPESIVKNKKVVLYCRIGERSKIAIQRLQDKYGYTNLVNLKGGIEAWKISN